MKMTKFPENYEDFYVKDEVDEWKKNIRKEIDGLKRDGCYDPALLIEFVIKLKEEL